jgi:hypothetical protein
VDVDPLIKNFNFGPPLVRFLLDSTGKDDWKRVAETRRLPNLLPRCEVPSIVFRFEGTCSIFNVVREGVPAERPTMGVVSG